MKKKVFVAAVCVVFITAIASASITQGLAVGASGSEASEAFVALPVFGGGCVLVIPEQAVDSVLNVAEQLGKLAQPAYTSADDLEVGAGEDISFEQGDGVVALTTVAGVGLNHMGLFSSLTLK